MTTLRPLDYVVIWGARCYSLVFFGLSFTNLILYSRERDHVIINQVSTPAGMTGSTTVTYFHSGPTPELYIHVLFLAALSAGLFVFNRASVRKAVWGITLISLLMSIYGAAHFLYLIANSYHIDAAVRSGLLPKILFGCFCNTVVTGAIMWMARNPSFDSAGSSEGPNPPFGLARSV